MGTLDKTDRTVRHSEIPSCGYVLAETEVIVEGVPWSVSVRLMPDHCHHYWIECDGKFVCSHLGGLFEDWPDSELPEDVLDAVSFVSERLSWA